MNPVWTKESLKTLQTGLLAAASEELKAWSADQLQQFLQRGFPQRRDEDWKYTSVTPIVEQEFSIDSKKAISDMDIIAAVLPDTYRIVFIDGCFIPALSELSDLPENVILTHAASIRRPPQPLLNSPSAFALLNGALIGDGLFLWIPPEVQLKKTVHVLYMTTEASGIAPMQNPRHFLQLGAGSRASVLEEYIGLSEKPYFNNVVMQIEVGANACLDYYKFQREHSAAFHIAATEIRQHRDSRVGTYHIAAGSRLNREDLQIALQEPGAECSMTGLYYPQAGQHIDYHTRIDHLAARTHSRQYYKGILGGRGVFNGKIVVHPKLRHISADQANHNLLLSKSAEIDAKPELEIYSGDIQCTHGATVGYLDENALFYLRSRGILESEARRLLLSGFAGEIFDRLPDLSISQTIRKYWNDGGEQYASR